MKNEIEVITEILSIVGYSSARVSSSQLPVLDIPAITISDIHVPPSFIHEFEQAIAHVARVIIAHRIGCDIDDVSIVVDIDGALSKKIRDLQKQVAVFVSRAQAFRTPITLPPMSGLERKVLHTLIQRYDDVTTESVGLGRDRHIVILPADKNSHHIG